MATSQNTLETVFSTLNLLFQWAKSTVLAQIQRLELIESKANRISNHFQTKYPLVFNRKQDLNVYFQAIRQERTSKQFGYEFEFGPFLRPKPWTTLTNLKKYKKETMNKILHFISKSSYSNSILKSKISLKTIPEILQLKMQVRGLRVFSDLTMNHFEIFVFCKSMQIEKSRSMGNQQKLQI